MSSVTQVNMSRIKLGWRVRKQPHWTQWVVAAPCGNAQKYAWVSTCRSLQVSQQRKRGQKCKDDGCTQKAHSGVISRVSIRQNMRRGGVPIRNVPWKGPVDRRCVVQQAAQHDIIRTAVRMPRHNGRGTSGVQGHVTAAG